MIANVAMPWARQLRSVLAERRHAQMVIPWSSPPSDRPTLYFLTPDQQLPSGGVLVIYRHVDLLNAAGLRAAVLHQRRGFSCRWFEHHTRVTDVASTRLGPGDVLVISEPDVDLLRDRPQALRHIVLNQNGHLTWVRAAEQVSQHYRRGAGLAGVVTVSAHSAAVLRHAFGEELPIHHVRPSIDADLFHAGAATRQREICYMPRRGRRDADSVLELLRLRGMLQGWRVTPLDGLSHAQVAERLRSATIYLALSGQEGFGLPAAEAMACGNYVVGYHGYGGREFFDPAWSCAVDAGDVLAVARAVEEVIRHEQTEPGWCMARGRLASRFVLQTYSTEREAVDVPRVYAVLTGLRAEPLQQPAATH